jgi:hypothetical protein
MEAETMKKNQDFLEVSCFCSSHLQVRLLHNVQMRRP